MKLSLLFFMAGMIFIMSGFYGCKNVNKNKITNVYSQKCLLHLLEQKEYFRLETNLEKFKDSISEVQYLYFQSFIDNAFNRNEKSIRDIDTLLDQYSGDLADSVKANLYRLQDDCYFKLGRYALAARCDSIILARYKNVIDSTDQASIKNHFQIHNALENIPPQQTFINNRTTIPWTHDRIGLIAIPVSVRGKNYQGIFDTRANISCVTQTYAAKLGLKMLDVSYTESSGITGISFKSSLGVADSMYVGDILVRNTVFQVMPDSILYIAPIHMMLNLIIGFPVIEQMQEIHIFKDGKMVIPVEPAGSDIHNFALDGLDPVVSLKNGNDTLCFHLDMGADHTVLYYEYFTEHQKEILKKAVKKTVQYGGAGGSQEKEVYVLPSFDLTLGNNKITLDSVDVLTKKIFPDEKYYGNVGRDFTDQFDELVFNFRDMYIEGN